MAAKARHPLGAAAGGTARPARGSVGVGSPPRIASVAGHPKGTFGSERGGKAANEFLRAVLMKEKIATHHRIRLLSRCKVLLVRRIHVGEGDRLPGGRLDRTGRQPELHSSGRILFL